MHSLKNHMGTVHKGMYTEIQVVIPKEQKILKSSSVHLCNLFIYFLNCINNFQIIIIKGNNFPFQLLRCRNDN